MPELPEVETVRRDLEKFLVGRRIEQIRISYPRLVQSDMENFLSHLTGATVVAMNRRGKYLLFNLGEETMVSHLRMEGKWLLFPKAEVPENKHFHAFFDLDNDQTLVYQDVRKFGTLELVKTSSLLSYFTQKKLGAEPTEEELDLVRFERAILSSRKPLKSRLLDQVAVSGLGNIYVDEVLWASNLHPQRLSSSLASQEVATLRNEIIRIMALAIDMGGSTIRSYRNALGEDGRMQDYHQVYGKTGQPCPRCQTPIEKIKIGGRGTHYCPQCQKI